LRARLCEKLAGFDFVQGLRDEAIANGPAVVRRKVFVDFSGKCGMIKASKKGSIMEKFNSYEADKMLEDFIQRIVEKYPGIKEEKDNLDKASQALRKEMFMRQHQQRKGTGLFVQARYAETFAQCQFFRCLLIKARIEYQEMKQNKASEDEIKKAQFICELITSKGKESYKSLLFGKTVIEKLNTKSKCNAELGDY